MNKKGLNKKVMLGAMTLAMTMVIIAVSSFFPFVVDPSRWQTEKFLTDELMIVAITIFATVSMMLIAEASNADDERSEIARAKVRFHSTVSKVNRVSFKQWVTKVQQPADAKEAKERKLAQRGIDDPSILELGRAEIKALVGKPQKYGDRYYKDISKKQCKYLLEMKEGKHGIKRVSPDSYLTYSKIGGKHTRTEEMVEEAAKKIAFISSSLISRILLGLILGMTVASFVYDMTAAKTEAQRAEAWLTFASRTFAFFSSMFQGWLIGSKMNDIDAYYIGLRCDTQDEFLQSGYVGKTEQEIAREKYIERVKEENAEYGKILLGGPNNV